MSPIQIQTTAQSLGSLLKSARDIMHKDKGLNGDPDRLPMITSITFLKFLDDLELQREAKSNWPGISSSPPSNRLPHLATLSSIKAEREFWMNCGVGRIRGKLGHAI